MNERRILTNELEHLTFGGCDTVELAKKYGTPLYVMDEDILRINMRECMEAMKKFFPSFAVYYASKACIFDALVKIAKEEGLCMDVVSAGELNLALKAGMPGEKIALHGNVKTPFEIMTAIQNDCLLVIDSLDEIEDIASTAQQLHKVAKVMVRVTPGVEAHTHAYIQTGILDCKFSLGIEDGQALKAIKTILEYDTLEFLGIHCHIGSQILDPEPYELTGHNMAAFALQVEKITGAAVRELTMGGGFGIHYTDEDRTHPVEDYIAMMYKGLSSVYEKVQKPLPRIHIEPGRFIVGNAGITLYTAYVRKEIPGVRTYVSIDGGMADNPRPMLYQSKYEALIANRPLNAPEESVHLAGRCCESGDVLIENLPLPKIRKGEVVAVFSTGAYNYAMASNYNRLPIPALVLVHKGQSAVAVRRQSVDDMAGWEEYPSYWIKEGEGV